MILDHIRTRFLGGDLYARATYTRVYTVSKNDYNVSKATRVTAQALLLLIIVQLAMCLNDVNI